MWCPVDESALRQRFCRRVFFNVPHRVWHSWRIPGIRQMIKKESPIRRWGSRATDLPKGRLARPCGPSRFPPFAGDDFSGAAGGLLLHVAALHQSGVTAPFFGREGASNCIPVAASRSEMKGTI